jgi:hypothetical protein
MYFDTGYLIFVLPAMIFAFYAQSKVRKAFDTYSRRASSSGKLGSQVARELLDASGLGDVRVEMTQGTLGDHYDPRTKVMRLSREVYSSNSLAALGVAAHEVGHAVQDVTAYAPLHLRNGLVPVAQFGSTLAFPLFLIGLVFRQGLLMDMGLLFFAGAVAFTIITLPVEYNASGRAIGLLEAGGYVRGGEIQSVRAVLDAAALTYLAATAMAIAQFLRLLSLRNRR